MNRGQDGEQDLAHVSPRLDPGPAARPPLPLSPTKISRTEEKRVLGNFNNRLASYIEKVRNLEQENGRLEQQVGPAAFS